MTLSRRIATLERQASQAKAQAYIPDLEGYLTLTGDAAAAVETWWRDNLGEVIPTKEQAGPHATVYRTGS